MLQTFFHVLVSSFSFAGPPANLSVEALKCYNHFMQSDDLLIQSKAQLPALKVEKLAVQICTYSDALGARACYQQAGNDSKILASHKQFQSDLNLEAKFVSLCSNSHAQLINSTSKDLDSIDCYKEVDKNANLLIHAKQYLSNLQLEDLFIHQCISSNSKGARTCITETYANPDAILVEHNQSLTPLAYDQEVVRLCRGTRVH